MDIITRFVNAGWTVKILNKKTSITPLVEIHVQKDGIYLPWAEGRNFKEAKQDLCLINNVELSVFDKV